MITRAVVQLYPEAAVVRYDADNDTLEAWDDDGNAITLDRSNVDARSALEDLRDARNEMLASTDWWAGSDHTMTQAQTDYRQALRDITDNATSLDDVTWPTKP